MIPTCLLLYGVPQVKFDPLQRWPKTNLPLEPQGDSYIALRL